MVRFTLCAACTVLVDGLAAMVLLKEKSARASAISTMRFRLISAAARCAITYLPRAASPRRLPPETEGTELPRAPRRSLNRLRSIAVTQGLS